MEPWVVATGLIFLYLLVSLGLGVVANRRMTVDLEDFLLYGRKAGFVVLYLTVVVSSLIQKNVRLAQELALLRSRMEEIAPADAGEGSVR